jgi:hypothetical protein
MSTWDLTFCVYLSCPTAVAFSEKSNFSSFEHLKFFILVSPLKGSNQNFILTLFLLSDFKIIRIYLSIIEYIRYQLLYYCSVWEYEQRIHSNFYFCVFSRVYIFDHVTALRETSHVYRQAGNPWLLGKVLCRIKVYDWGKPCESWNVHCHVNFRMSE